MARLDTAPRVVDANGFADWVVGSAPGDVVEYHRGLLARDRAMPKAHEIDMLGTAAWQSCAAGRVALVQRRIGEGVCAYLAIRTGAERARKRPAAPDGEGG